MPLTGLGKFDDALGDDSVGDAGQQARERRSIYYRCDRSGDGRCVGKQAASFFTTQSEDVGDASEANDRDSKATSYPGRALPSYMNVIGLGPCIYPLSSRSVRNPAFSISSSIARFR